MRRRAAALLCLSMSSAALAQGGRRRAPDPAEIAERDRAFAALAPIPSASGERVTLLVPPGEKAKPEWARLAAELNRAAAGMAPRVGGHETPSKPVTVVVEPDHPRHRHQLPRRDPVARIVQADHRGDFERPGEDGGVIGAAAGVCRKAADPRPVHLRGERRRQLVRDERCARCSRR